MSKKDQNFIKKVLRAMEDIDNLKVESIEVALEKMIKDLTYDLNEVIDMHERYEFKALASISNIGDKRLEENYKEFLERLIQYANGVDKAFHAKAVRYGKLAAQYQLRIATPDENKHIKDILIKIAEHEISFKKVIQRVKDYSHKRLEESKKVNLTRLKKYESLFKKLSFYENLTWREAVELLIKKGKISSE
jgi:hypothetical protein